MAITFSNLVARQAAWNLNATNAKLGESILRLSSGLKVQSPRDGLYEYIRGSSLESNIRLYQGIRSGLSEYRSILSIANDAAGEIRKKLESMQEKAVAGSDPGMDAKPTELSNLFTEFNTLRASIENIVNGANYEGGNILKEAGTYNKEQNVTITPDRSVTLDIDLNKLDVIDAPGTVLDGIVIDDTAWADHDDAVASSAQITKSLERVDAFMAEAGSYLSEIESNIRMNDSLTQNFAAARSALVEVDLADEMATYTALDVQKQAGQAVLAQANLSYRSLLKLYEFSYGT